MMNRFWSKSLVTLGASDLFATIAQADLAEFNSINAAARTARERDGIIADFGSRIAERLVMGVDSGAAGAYDECMPTVFEKEGYRFFFYSNDHEPVHVHVRRGGGEAVFDVGGEIALRESQGLKVQELTRAQEPEENKALIIRKWNEHLG